MTTRGPATSGGSIASPLWSNTASETMLMAPAPTAQPVAATSVTAPMRNVSAEGSSAQAVATPTTPARAIATEGAARWCTMSSPRRIG